MPSSGKSLRLIRPWGQTDAQAPQPTHKRHRAISKMSLMLQLDEFAGISLVGGITWIGEPVGLSREHIRTLGPNGADSPNAPALITPTQNFTTLCP